MKRKRRTVIETDMLNAMRGAGKRRYVRPWTLGELRPRAHVTVGLAEKALARLVRKGDIRRTDGLPIVYYLEV